MRKEQRTPPDNRQRMSDNKENEVPKSSKPDSATSFCSACSEQSNTEDNKEINDLTNRITPTDSEEKFRKHVRISEDFKANILKQKKKEKQVVYENDEVLYVVGTSEPQSKASSKTSSKISFSQTFSNFSFYNKSSKKKREVKESAICRCQEKFDIVRKHSYISTSSSSSGESLSGHNCIACRCVNCPLKHQCWFT